MAIKRASVTPKKERKKEEKHPDSVLIMGRLQQILKIRKMSFDDLAKQLKISTSGLYRAFNRGKVTILMLEKIAVLTKVDTFYFFEAVVTDRMVERIARSRQTKDLKDFALGFSLDVKNGDSIDRAVTKALETEDERRFRIGAEMSS